MRAGHWLRQDCQWWHCSDYPSNPGLHSAQENDRQQSVQTQDSPQGAERNEPGSSKAAWKGQQAGGSMKRSEKCQSRIWALRHKCVVGKRNWISETLPAQIRVIGQIWAFKHQKKEELGIIPLLQVLYMKGKLEETEESCSLNFPILHRVTMRPFDETCSDAQTTSQKLQHIKSKWARIPL